MTQIKPLTAEEKKAKIEELRSKLAEKRAAASKEDAKAQRANEVGVLLDHDGLWVLTSHNRHCGGKPGKWVPSFCKRESSLKLP